MREINANRRSALGLMSAGALTAGLGAAVPAAARALPQSNVDAAINAAYHQYLPLTEGKNADYIPALAEVPSTYFGIALVGADGQIHSAGDVEQPFSIQSISKVFNMALVMKESGQQRIIDSVGVDATGQVFNSIEAVEQYRGKEMNPLVNPGAIATVGNIQGTDPDQIWAKIIGIHSDFAGRQLEVNQPVYQSEAATNQRNRAIGSLMSAYDRFAMDPAVATELYTRGCSINVTARDLAVMGATLAFGGRNPVTGKQVIDSSLVPGILAVMATAGLYDDSGKWLFKTGLPAKSGVGGGLMAVAPGKFGIGTFAPPLDEAGNSVRGQRAIIDIVNALHANPYAQFG
ncbi:glutaminase A [Brevundimonas lenta]|uniref:Glutaminase n=1 Tax=Brevundimonas lenta TaxID=424796 RepID=A0A7W6JHN8_9CAUL|nr:glutaminase A [Brevundimonas lenta]MBB4084297.1 glutaminase [Brevundimonas lenta]